MKIAIITESFLPKIDGIVTMLDRTVKCLRQSGDEVVIFAPSGGPGELYGAEVVAMPSFSFPLYPELRLALPRTSMRRKLAEFQPDVLHIFEPALLGIGGIYYSQELRIPLVVSYHTNLPAYLKYYKLGAIEEITWMLMRERHRRANLNLCTSTAMIGDLQAHGIGNLALWERAVDTDRFRPAARSAAVRARFTGGDSAGPLLLYVGRLSAEKNVARLLELFPAVHGMKLAIVGDGPLRRELERKFAGTATVFTGYLEGEELAQAYASADLFVMPSETETLGLVLMEAMAAGCPVVACRAGGVPDAVQDGANSDNATGFLFDPNEPSSFVETVVRACNSNGRLEGVRARARQDVEQHSWAASTEKLRLLYAQAAREGYRKPVKGRVPIPKRIAAGIARGTLRTLLP